MGCASSKNPRVQLTTLVPFEKDTNDSYGDVNVTFTGSRKGSGISTSSGYNNNNNDDGNVKSESGRGDHKHGKEVGSPEAKAAAVRHAAHSHESSPSGSPRIPINDEAASMKITKSKDSNGTVFAGDVVFRKSFMSCSSSTSSPKSEPKSPNYGNERQKREEKKEAEKESFRLAVWEEAEKLMDTYLEDYGREKLIDIFRDSATEDIVEMSFTKMEIEGELDSLAKKPKKYTFNYVKNSNSFGDGGFRKSDLKNSISSNESIMPKLEMSLSSTSEEVVQKLRDLKQVQCLVSDIEVGSLLGSEGDVDMYNDGDSPSRNLDDYEETLPNNDDYEKEEQGGGEMEEKIVEEKERRRE